LDYLSPPPPSLREKILIVSKVFKKKKNYLSSDYDFEKDKENFEDIGGPIHLKEIIGNCVGVLHLKIIPDGVSKELYKIASIVEKNGRPIE
jgi:transposase